MRLKLALLYFISLFSLWIGLASANPPGTYNTLFLAGSCNTSTNIILTSGTSTTNTTGCTNFKIHVIAGGAGANDRAGGAGGCYSGDSTSISFSSTTLFYQIGQGGAGVTSSGAAGNAGTDSWIRRDGVNSVPTSISEGFLAKGGPAPPGGDTGASACSTAAGFGTNKFAGGSTGGRSAGLGSSGGGGAAGNAGAGGNGAAPGSSAGTNGGQGNNGTGGAGGVAPSGAGSDGTEILGSKGSGGGGGGTSTGSATKGGAGGSCGGGGGGGQPGGVNGGGDGSNGCILLQPVS